MRLFACLEKSLKEPKSKKQTADNCSHITSPLILPQVHLHPLDALSRNRQPPVSVQRLE